MAAYPSQLLITLFLGLCVTAALGFAVYLLTRLRRRPARVITRSPGGAIVPHRDDVRSRRRKAAVLAVVVAIVGASFGGRHLVRAFYPSGEKLDVATARVRSVAGASGAQLAVVRMGSRDGPALVMTHGWGADRGDWSYAVARLPQGFDVVLWDLPGLGQSTAASDYSIPALAADLERVVSSIGDKPVVLVGHSIGGILNLEYMRQFPDRAGRNVVGMVQVNTTYTNPIETKKNAERSRALQKPVFEPLLKVVTVASPVARALGWLAYQSGLAHLQLATQSFAGAETWQQLDHMASYAYRSSPGVVARGVLAMLGWDGSDVLPMVKVPTLVIAGDRDTTTLPAASERMRRDIPVAEQVTIAHAAHLGPVEQAELYAQAIASFAKRAVGGKGAALAWGR